MEHLTPKQQQFIQEYLIDLNGAQAAIRAGYSEHTARQIATENLAKPYVQEALWDALRARRERTQVSQDRVIEQLVRIAFADIRDFITFGPEGVTIKKSDTVDGTVVSEVSNTQVGVKVKLNDRIRALEMLSRHLGLFAAEKREISGPGGGPVQVENNFDLSSLTDEELNLLEGIVGKTSNVSK